MTSIGMQAFSWTPSGGMQNLGTPGGSWACGINNNNEVVGFSADFFAGWNKAFKWSQADGMKDLGGLSGQGGFAYGINNSGWVVGSSNAPWPNSHAFLWTQSGGMQDLGTLGGNSSSAYSINNGGNVVGMSHSDTYGTNRAFLWTPSGGMQSLNDIVNNLPSGTNLISASCINDKNQIVGYLWDQRPDATAFLWSASEGLKTLGTLVDPNLSGSFAYGINKNGQVVGMANANDGNLHAFSWTSPDGMQDLNTLAVNKPSDVTLTTGYGINSNGQIVGVASNGAFLLSPTKISIDIPTPTATPPLLAFPLTSNLFPEISSFIKNNLHSFDAGVQQNINSLGDRWQQFLLKDLSSEGWKNFFKGVQQTGEAIGYGISLGSIGDTYGKGLISLGNNNIELANSYFKMAAFDLSVLTGKYVSTQLNLDWEKRLLISAAGTGASIGVGALLGTLTPVTAALAANGLIWGDFVAGAASDLAKDPPDPNFKEVFQSPLSFTGPLNFPGASPELNRILGQEFGSLCDTYYFLVGITTSINRYSSALEAGDTASAGLQIAAFLKYLTLYDSSAIQSADLIKQLEQALINEGFLDVSYNRQYLLDFQTQLRLNGLPQDIIDYYKSLGLTDSDIAALMQAMLDFVPPDSLSGSLYSNLSDGADLFLSASSASVPLPSTLFLAGPGLLGLFGWRQFKRVYKS